MFVLGIDPGLSRCGYGCVQKVGGELVAVAAGVIVTSPSEPLEERLVTLYHELGKLVKELAPDTVVVERVLFQTNARTAMSVGQASGLALVAAVEAGCSVAQYSANEVKQAVVGYGGATKAQVQHMVTRLLSLDEEPQPPDVADALALAFCHLTTQPLHESVRRALSGQSRRTQGQSVLKPPAERRSIAPSVRSNASGSPGTHDRAGLFRVQGADAAEVPGE
ncbi:MAG: crossover junction endodeoxyribonuclease RuvC [Acidimicrobiales bacterium]